MTHCLLFTTIPKRILWIQFALQSCCYNLRHFKMLQNDRAFHGMVQIVDVTLVTDWVFSPELDWLLIHESDEHYVPNQFHTLDSSTENISKGYV